MKFLYAVENGAELERYQRIAASFRRRLDDYIEFLKMEYQVRELPRAVLWTSRETATERISDIPVPAYTNEYRVVMTPERETWREIYLKQLDCIRAADEIRRYYESELTDAHILQILGHELAHHSALFLDDFDDTEASIWFEEGMAEYISRRYFLSDAQFCREAEINRKLVELLTPRYGNHSLEEFGKETYRGNYASIFFEYWRSFLAVNEIVNAHGGDVMAVFSSYRKWYEEGSNMTLSEWFQI